MKQARNPGNVHPPVGRYVHSIEVTGENRMLFISGQVGRNVDGTLPEDAAAQFELALQNVIRNVEAAGFEPTDVVKIVTYAVADVDPKARRESFDRVFGEHLTTSTLVYVPRLVSSDYLVEVDAWAIR